jgi:hypothetical protein
MAGGGCALRTLGSVGICGAVVVRLDRRKWRRGVDEWPLRRFSVCSHLLLRLRFSSVDRLHQLPPPSTLFSGSSRDPRSPRAAISNSHLCYLSAKIVPTCRSCPYPRTIPRVRDVPRHLVPSPAWHLPTLLTSSYV